MIPPYAPDATLEGSVGPVNQAIITNDPLSSYPSELDTQAWQNAIAAALAEMEHAGSSDFSSTANTHEVEHEQRVRRGTKWTLAMDEFLQSQKQAGDTYAVIAEKMGLQFGVAVNANMLGKRYKAIAKQTSNNSIVHKALVNAAPKIVDAVMFEIQQLSISDEQMLDAVNKDMLSKLPDLLQEAAVDLWVQVQAQARRK
jgi:hypothetical protein